MLRFNVAEVENSPMLRRLLERGFHLVVEAMLDVCRHIVSAMGWGPALSYSNLVTICVERDVIDEDLGEKLVNAMRLRSIIVHRYLEVDYGKLYEESRRLIDIAGRFERRVVKFIEGSVKS